ncbi:dehypoxanthine futalosine cyclase [bacterium]|nr:dehypoxanthine futalosine cyclase [bacterium]
MPSSRITFKQAVEWLHHADMYSLGAQAHDLRLRQASPHDVSYVVDRNINYSNICSAHCKFCAFSRTAKDEDAYVLEDEELFKKIEALVQAKGTQVLLQGGLHPKLPLSYYCEMLSKIKDRFPVDLHAFSAPEIVHFTRITKKSIKNVLQELQAAGLDTIPGGGAEILVDRVRRETSLGRPKTTADEWLAVHEAAHELGMRTTATMMFGHVETFEERIEHLDRIRTLQDKTGGFTAFIPWTFQAPHTEMESVEEWGAVEYLKTLAISRLYLDNIHNIQASFITQGKQIGQIALFYGANDMGGTMMEENVVAATGIHNCSNELEIRRLIEDAGFQPQKRNTLYQYLN